MFTLFFAPWGKWFPFKDRPPHQYMKNDINEGPAHVFCFQEATQALCQDLKDGWNTPQESLVRCPESNKRKMAKDSPKQTWLVVRGCEPGPTTAVAVRDAYFKGIRRDCYVKQDAGSYKNDGEWKEAFIRLMFCTIKCREHYFETGKDEDDEIGIAVAHMHYGLSLIHI